MRSCVVFLIAAVVAISAQGQQLWRGVAIGMDVAAVRQAIPEAEAFDPGQRNRLDSGATQLLQVPSFEVIGQRFTAALYFLDGRLTQVTLSGRDLPGTGEPEYRQLLEVLRSKYGEPVSARLERGRLGVTGAASWSVAGATIRLSILGYGGNKADAFIIYNGGLAKDAAKL